MTPFSMMPCQADTNDAHKLTWILISSSPKAADSSPSPNHPKGTPVRCTADGDKRGGAYGITDQDALPSNWFRLLLLTNSSSRRLVKMYWRTLEDKEASAHDAHCEICSVSWQATRIYHLEVGLNTSWGCRSCLAQMAEAIRQLIADF